MQINLELIRIGFPNHYTAEQIVRSIRNKLLQESDWAVLPDVPTDKAEWETYRQELRDVPQNWDGGDAVEFPDKPQ